MADKEQAARLLTPFDLGAAFFEMLQAHGLPKNCEAIDVSLRTDAPIMVTCTFAVEGSDGQLVVVKDELQRAIRNMHLVFAPPES